LVLIYGFQTTEIILSRFCMRAKSKPAMPQMARKKMLGGH